MKINVPVDVISNFFYEAYKKKKEGITPTVKAGKFME